MPIYQYKCAFEDCSHEVEVIQKISDEPLLCCPECGSETLKKQVCARTVIKMTGVKP